MKCRCNKSSKYQVSSYEEMMQACDLCIGRVVITLTKTCDQITVVTL